MKKRDFIKTSAIGSAALFTTGIWSCDNTNTQNGEEEKTTETPAVKAMVETFELPDLGYDYTALAPNIDAQTMEIHHSKHHAGYVRKLNIALEKTPVSGSLEGILATIDGSSNYEALRNNAGGHWNHSLFWKCIDPNSNTKQPEGELMQAIQSSFESMDEFKTQFFDAAKSVFGSGWAWLCKNDEGSLFITTTENQDNPLMTNIVDETGTPILGIDVWEHAYYLNYQNKRGDYINAWMELINWKFVESQFIK